MEAGTGVKHYAVYLAIPSTGGCYWEVWTAGTKNDRRVAKGTGFDIAQAMEHASAWLGKGK